MKTHHHFALASLLFACDRPPVTPNCDFDAAVPCPNLNQPAGRIDGTVIYQGPPPPTSMVTGRSTLAAGRVILLLFGYDDPPPPDGTATSALSFQTVSAGDLFANAQSLPDGTVRATIPFSFPNITTAGVYEIRAFYSHVEQITYAPDGTPAPIVTTSGFDPLFSVRNEPVFGDVGGGAVVDPSATVAQFVPITVGDPGRPIPTDGVVVGNVTVFLGRVFDTERPMFNVLTSAGPSAPAFVTIGSVPPPPPIDPMTSLPTPGAALVQYAHDTGLLPVGSPQITFPRNYVVTQPDTGADLPAFSISAGLPAPSAPGAPDGDECAIAALAGVLCPSDVGAQIGFFERAYDRIGNGMIDFSVNAMPPFGDAHPTLLTTAPLAAMSQGHLPWLYPLVIFSKLHEPNATEVDELTNGIGGVMTPALYAQLVASLNRPEAFDPDDGVYPVLLFGTVLPQGNASSLLLHPWADAFQLTEDPMRVGIVPIAVEVHGPNPATDWWPIIPPQVPALVSAAQPWLPPNYCCFDYDPYWDQFGGDFPDQAGVPVGRYAMTVINHNGQAWTVPNELSAFANAACDGGVCTAPSQTLVVRTLPAVAPTIPVACPTPEEAGAGCTH